MMKARNQVTGDWILEGDRMNREADRDEGIGAGRIGRGRSSAVANYINRPTGAIFSVPSQSVLISAPKIGDIVSFTYEVHARRDLPVSPKVYRVRTDVTWEDLVLGEFKDNKIINGM